MLGTMLPLILLGKQCVYRLSAVVPCDVYLDCGGRSALILETCTPIFGVIFAPFMTIFYQFNYYIRL